MACKCVQPWPIGVRQQSLIGFLMAPNKRGAAPNDKENRPDLKPGDGAFAGPMAAQLED